MPLIKRNNPGHAPSVIDVPVSQMSAAEYSQWLSENPEEQAKMDEPVEKARVGKKQAFFVNGRYVDVADNQQLVSNGVVQPKA